MIMDIEFIKPERVINNGRILCCITTKKGGYSKHPYNLNMSFKVNDDAESVLKNRKAVYETLGINRQNIVIQKQIHSTNISYVESSGMIEANDVLFTDKKNLFLVVSVADCYPIFLADKGQKAVAAIHSGWRGTQSNISGLTVERLKQKFNIRADDLNAFIGPGICKEHFEVGQEVYEKFSDEVKTKINGKFYVDLRKEIYNQLINAGLKPYNIEVSNLCTFSENELLHSYRRDKEKSGRMFGIIGLLP